MKKLLKICSALAVVGGVAWGGWHWHLEKQIAKAREINEDHDGARLWAEVRQEQFEQKVVAYGAVTPIRSTMIQPAFDGFIQKIFVKVGDKVKAGDPVAVVSQSPQADQEVVYPLRSPLSGTVVAQLHSPGEFVQKAINREGSEGIVRIDDLSHFFVDSEIPEIDYGAVKVGQPVEISLNSRKGKIYNGQVEYLALSSQYRDRWERSNVMFAIRVRVSNPDEYFKSGLSASLSIITKKIDNALIVDDSAIRYDAAQSKFFLIDDKGVRHDVELGSRNTEKAVIISGASVGMKYQKL
jgi:multidrug efflux pump subunit AcrA (membrane-fusion protein)